MQKVECVLVVWYVKLQNSLCGDSKVIEEKGQAFMNGWMCGCNDPVSLT
jgi:hypothetical protein